MSCSLWPLWNSLSEPSDRLPSWSVVVVQRSSCVQLFAIQWTGAHPSPFPGVCSSSCPLHQWCCSTILSSVILLSSCFQSFLASGSFPMSWLFASGAQSIEASASATVGCSPQEYSRIKPNSPLLDCAFSLQWTATKSLFYFNEKKKRKKKESQASTVGKHCVMGIA